jgi:hypothetical protein
VIVKLSWRGNSDATYCSVAQEKSLEVIVNFPEWRYDMLSNDEEKPSHAVRLEGEGIKQSPSPIAAIVNTCEIMMV